MEKLVKPLQIILWSIIVIGAIMIVSTILSLITTAMFIWGK